MNLGQLKSELRMLVDDSSFENELTMYLNEAYVYATNEVTIPSLKRMTTVETVPGVNWVSLSSISGFSGKLLRLAGPQPIVVFESLEALFDEYADDGVLANEEGSVEAVALEGSVLWYQKIPAAAETLTVIYSSDPALLEDDADQPIALPLVAQRNLLVYGAAAIIFDAIEDGIEGQKINTGMCFARRNEGINTLRLWVGNRRKNVTRSVWRV